MNFKCFYILCLITGLCSCKKYPEDTLWFKNPQNIPFMEGNMTHYVVNGIDSINYLDNYFYPDFYNNPYSHSFSDLQVGGSREAKGVYSLVFEKPGDYFFPNSIVSGVKYYYEEKDKKLKLSGTQNILDGYRKNIFLSDEVLWEIMYLSKKDKKRIMKGLYKGTTYQIQFN